MIISQLSDIVCTIMIMSLSGSALILLLFALKPLIRHQLPKSVQYVLWLVTLAALLVPVSKLIAIPDAPSHIIVAPIQNAVEQNNIAGKEAADTLSQTNTVSQTDRTTTKNPGVKPAMHPVFTAATVLMIIYMLIVLVVLSYYIVSYVRFTRRVRRHRTRARMEELYEHVGLCGDTIAPRLYRSALTTTPMLIGIFKPEIILPDREYTGAQFQSVLKHELTHLRRRDIIVKWLSVLARAVHWFNPLVWLALREIDRICELSCDEAVIRTMDHAGKRSYGETLISIAADNNASRAVLSTTMCEEKEVLKERLNLIMKYQKRTWVTLVISTIIIFAAVFTAFVMGARAASAPGDNMAGAVAPASVQSALPSDSAAAQPHSPSEKVIEFKDPIVEKVISAKLKKPEGAITEQDMLKIEDFEFNDVRMNIYSGKIKTIEDLRWCVNLKSIFLASTDITDISALSGMRNLESVCIMEKLDDFTPLLGNKNLTEIQLTGAADNFFRDLMKNCRMLSSVGLTKSDVSPESIRMLAMNFKLTTLVMNFCYIKDVTPFIDFTGLEYLSLENNYIKDISVFAANPELSKAIDLSGNQITDWSPLEDMTLLSLNVYDNPVTKSPALDKLEKKGCEIYR